MENRKLIDFIVHMEKPLGIGKLNTFKSKIIIIIILLFKKIYNLYINISFY